jgi:hypothetical protein
MKRLLFISLAILTAAAGCGTNVPAADIQKPTAYIDEISPAEALPEAMVSFMGHGTDPISDIVAWRWRSDLDGELSSRQSFDISSLSDGEHTIYFKVQNERGAWSEEVSGTVQISGVAASEESSKPVITSFSASPVSIEVGGSSELSWEVSNATDVSIDQEIGPVSLSGATGVSPLVTMVYTVNATNAVGSVTASAQVIVSAVYTPPSPGPSPPSPSPQPFPSPVPAPELGFPQLERPDLVITDIWLIQGEIVCYILNQGLKETSSNSVVELFIDGIAKKSVSLNSGLNPGTKVIISFSYSHACTGISDTVMVRADKNNNIKESNEGNNEYSEVWSCLTLKSN